MTRVLMVGGGSGGHITPLLAVAHEVKRLQPEACVMYVGQTGDSLGDIPKADPSVDEAYTVRAGKLRRYHGEGLRQLFDVPTTAKNIRDIFYVAAGFLQSVALLRRIKPDVVFVKGGFVGVPVGFAAALLRIPYITHDSDAIPGLANRLIARWAKLHAVALPAEVYHYPHAKTLTVGVPISHQFRQRTVAELADLRKELGLHEDGPVLLVTGGGLGAKRMNDAVITIASALFQTYPNLTIVHLAGRSQEDDVNRQYDMALAAASRRRVRVFGFTTELYKYSAVADAVVTRAGGNSMAELAAQAKPCVVVPNPLLTGGHQTKNAQVLADRKAILLVDEPTLQQDHEALLPAITQLLSNPEEAAALGEQLRSIARPDAAERLAVVLLEESDKTKEYAIQKETVTDTESQPRP